ncbi:MAG: hypothetical protein ACU0CO_06330 [Shimia sp.]
MSDGISIWYFVAFVGLIVAILVVQAAGDRRRRATLRRDETGMYVWVDVWGRERCARDDPYEGWDAEGDGGDGGGD